MRITKEMWDKSASKNYNLVTIINSREFYLQVMKDICKKHACCLEIPRSGYEDYTMEELKELELYINNEFIKKFNLTPYGYKVSNMNFGKLGYVQFPSPGLLLGDDIVVRCTFGSDDEDGREDLNLPNSFIYTSDSSQTVFNMISDIVNFGKNLLSKREKDDTKIDIQYSIATVTRSKVGRIETVDKLVSVDKVDLTEFNEDLPNEDINQFLESSKSGILIFHGDPGCGKTSYIKYLISQHTDLKFVYCSLDIIQNSNKFRDFVLENAERRLVIITEDCETMLKSRHKESGATSIVSDILNMSNGLIGDFTKTKFIFTFNIDTKQIDEAILRDGRLVCEYEFKPLQGEKLIKLAEKLGKEVTEEEIRKGLTLAKLYKKKL